MNFGPWVQELVTTSNLPFLAAFLVGLLASLGPCALSSNIAALSYTVRQFHHPPALIATGLLYVVGRSVTYGLVGLFVLTTGTQISRIAIPLQNVADIGLGPLLIVVGLVLLDIFRPNLTVGSGRLMHLVEMVAHWRGVGAFFLGLLLALAFCPYTAALFFGILIPLAFRSTVGMILPLLFGIGTGIPVLLLGVPLALGLERATVGLNLLGRAEPVVRKLAAWTFILTGLFSVWRFVQAATSQ